VNELPPPAPHPVLLAAALALALFLYGWVTYAMGKYDGTCDVACKNDLPYEECACLTRK